MIAQTSLWLWIRKESWEFQTKFHHNHTRSYLKGNGYIFIIESTGKKAIYKLQPLEST